MQLQRRSGKKTGKTKSDVNFQKIQQRNHKCSNKKALQTDGREALKKVNKKPNDRVICALTFNPKLPSVSNIIDKHWKTMTTDTKMLKMFPKPPMVAFR